MQAFKMCVNSQTPLMKFMLTLEELNQKYGKIPSVVPISSLKEGEDYEFSPGGVTRMVFPLLKNMMKEGIVSEPWWVCLNPIGPENVTLDGVNFCHVGLKQDRMRGYSRIKEALWNAIHGLESPESDFVWQNDYIDYNYYNRMCGEQITRLDKEQDFDIFYIHDFQQLTVGSMLPPLRPKVFRWHIPFDESSIPFGWRAFLSRYLNSYDAVIVSCKSYLDALKKFGFKKKAYHVYPYVDQNIYQQPSSSTVDAFCAKHNIQPDDRVILVVARLDPMKGQDIAIKALAEVKKNVQNGKLKLVLIGNGSFSSSKQGIALSKAERWKERLLRLRKSLGLEENVVFAGHATHEELQAAYSRCDATLLPSIKEGFGLVVVESWLYKKPVIVSTGAGIAELIADGENGFLFNSGDSSELARRLQTVLSDETVAHELGNKGFESASLCFIESGVKTEAEILRSLV